MIYCLNRCCLLAVCVICWQSGVVGAAEWSVESDVDARLEYIDNIFLTTLPHESVTNISFIPTVDAIIKEEHWEAIAELRVKTNTYSDSSLDGNDQFYSLTGRYTAERNIFSLNVNYDLDSNLNSTSTDFGIVGRRIENESRSISPRYTRLLTERMALILSYVYREVDYLDAENTGFAPYTSETLSASLIYDLTERDRLTISIFGVDYERKDGLTTYQLLMSRYGIEHQFSTRLSADFLLGISRRTTTNLDRQEQDFFGDTVQRTIVIDGEDRGFVLDAGIKQLFELSEFEARISRDNTTNSFGGLDQTDRLSLGYKEKLSQRWRYNINTRIEDITSISTGSTTTDRDLFFFESRVSYNLTAKWYVDLSYRYVQRKFQSDTSDDRAPHSNRIYVGLSYNLPALSTF